MEDEQSPTEEPAEIPATGTTIIQREIEDEMKTSYLEYSMSVIIGRALPDVRDGLKPVHRRILFAMNEMGNTHSKPYKKCARIVGEVLGKYHPHGDSAVYEALARMVQTFSLRYPLIDGQGNFGSIDGDSPAAMRYTEARMAKTAESLLLDIEKETIPFVANFDNTLEEPQVLPSMFPNMLVNGSNGIAVGMATNIPSHNLHEITQAIVALIDNPELGPSELLEFVKGPDFPTGGLIVGTTGIRHYFSTGKGKIVMRAKTAIEPHKNRSNIIVTEIPYQVNKASLIEQIADLVKEKHIEGIDDIRDESDRHGMRIVIELKGGSNADIVLNQLYHHSNLQSVFGVIMLAIVDGAPKVLNFKEFVMSYIDHRKIVVRKRTEYELKAAAEKAHILEGLLIALGNIDKTVALIKKSRSVEDAKKVLIDSFTLTDKQAVAILEMRLQRLTSLEQGKVREEHTQLLEQIKEYNAILADEKRIYGIVKKEILDVDSQYGDERRTEILNVQEDELELETEDLVEPAECVITFTLTGYIKRTPLEYYKEQRRGGRGIIATQTKESDNVKDLFVANTKDYLLVFSNKGIVYWLRVYQLPEASRQSRGSSIANFLSLGEGEQITAFITLKNFESGYLMMTTKNGVVKKTELSAFSNPRKGGIIALGLEDGDELVDVVLTTGNDHILIATEKGNAIRFHEKDVRPMGRSAVGVIGIRMANDHVIGMVDAPEDVSLLTITENGYGKRTSIADYRPIHRGGQGVINIQCNERNGNVVAIRTVRPEEHLVFISQRGIILRTGASGISEIGRNTQGVRLMRLEEGDKVVSAAKVLDTNGEVDSAEDSTSQNPV
jgi:DNA gyrase subunit A